MIGKPITEESELADYLGGGEAKPNEQVIIAFLCGIVALGFTFSFGEKAPLYTALLAFAAAVFLIIFRINFLTFYELEGDEEYITIEYLWGWLTALFGLFVGGAISFYSYKTDLF